MARRRMSAKQRRFFGRRSTRRASTRRVSVARRSTRRARRSFGGSRSWLPLTGREHVSAAITGASAPVVMSWVRPYTDGFLGFAGDYKDEVATYAVGALATKFGPSGIVKEVGKDYARLAVFSAANQFATPMLAGLGNGTPGTLVSTSGVVQA